MSTYWLLNANVAYQLHPHHRLVTMASLLWAEQNEVPFVYVRAS
jgi:hypothetical protein